MAIRDFRWWFVFRLRLRSLFRRRAVERDLADELQDHVEAAVVARVARGEPPDRARTAVLRSLGTVESLKEQVRETRRVGLIEDVMRDLRYAARMLRRRPGFTAVAVVSLALGIGANTAIFQLLDAVRLRALPVERPEELAIIQIENRGWPPSDYNARYADLTYAQWERLKRDQRAFTGVLAWSNQVFDLSAQGESRFAENGLFVSGEFFEVLGVKPAAGRLFAAADDQPGCGAPAAVLSHAFWRREFAGRSDAIGTTLTIRGRPVPIVGIAAKGFHGVDVGRSFDFALPLCARPYLYGPAGQPRPAEWWLAAMGRLALGVSLPQSAAALASISPPIFNDTLPPSYGPTDVDAYLKFTLTARDGRAGFSELREQYGVPLWLLLGVSGLVLMMACVNLANLLLGRMSAREREMALRLALGASRRRLVRQLLVESLLIGALGASAGALLAPLSGRVIVAMMGTDVSPLFLDLGINWRLLGFAAALAIVTSIVFGLAPALRGSRVETLDAIRASGRTHTAGRRQTAILRALVAIQISLSVVLLSGGLLFGRSLYNLLTVDLGFRQADILEADVDLGRLDLPPEQRVAVRRALLSTLRALPEVEDVATLSSVPMVTSYYRFFYVDGPNGLTRQVSRANRISDRFFATLDMPLVAGRDFNAEDTPASPTALVVNEAFVRQVFGGGTPIGVTLRQEGARQQPGAPATIVGIVKNAKHGSLREDFPAIAYVADSQTAAPGTSASFLVRGRVPPAALKISVSRAIEHDIPGALFHFHDFQEQVRYSIRLDRVMAMLCGFFALLGGVLAAIGVYGVTAYSVAQRTTEIGVRLALGATSQRILRLILGEGVIVLAIGLAGGIAIARWTSTVAEGLLFGLTPDDPATLAVAAALLGAVALGASLAPALRASRVDPTRALRAE
jgi:putative ABC transport system permease protein